METQETVEDVSELLNKVIIKTTKRKNGSVRIQQDFTNCPTKTEQHAAHLTDINYLIERYKPDELAAYIAARNSNRQEIIGHDFSQEPSLQDAKNVIYASQQAFEQLPQSLKNQFTNHVEFLKYLDNPRNQETLVKLGVLDGEQISKLLDFKIIQPEKKPEAPTTPGGEAPAPKKE